MTPDGTAPQHQALRRKRWLTFTVRLSVRRGSTDDMVRREFGAILADELSGARHFNGYEITGPKDE